MSAQHNARRDWPLPPGHFAVTANMPDGCCSERKVRPAKCGNNHRHSRVWLCVSGPAMPLVDTFLDLRLKLNRVGEACLKRERGGPGTERLMVYIAQAGEWHTLRVSCSGDQDPLTSTPSKSESQCETEPTVLVDISAATQYALSSGSDRGEGRANPVCAIVLQTLGYGVRIGHFTNSQSLTDERTYLRPVPRTRLVLNYCFACGGQVWGQDSVQDNGSASGGREGSFQLSHSRRYMSWYSDQAAYRPRHKTISFDAHDRQARRNCASQRIRIRDTLTTPQASLWLLKGSERRRHPLCTLTRIRIEGMLMFTVAETVRHSPLPDKWISVFLLRRLCKGEKPPDDAGISYGVAPIGFSKLRFFAATLTAFSGHLANSVTQMT